MIDLRLTIPFRIVDPIVNNPKSIFFRIDIHACNYPNSLDHIFRIPTPLSPNWLYLK